MFEIENCYRIIFESMLEDSALGCMAERIGKYTGAGVMFVTGTGRVLASFLWGSLFLESVEKGHLTWADYEVLQRKEDAMAECLYVTSVYSGRMVVGYILLIDEKLPDEEEDKGKETLREVGIILADNVKGYFEKEQKQYVFNQPLREHMIGWTLFEDGDAKMIDAKNCPQEKYMTVLLRKQDGEIEASATRLYSVWNSMHIYEEREDVFLLLYRLTDRDVISVREGIEAAKIKCCVSEVYTKICLCKSRKNILKRMALVEDPWDKSVIRREKEWSMQGMYTYTAPLIEKGGLSDYSIGSLLLEDEKNNTELYHTLKVYLLCENNITAAAKTLHIHRNTLVYRLKQIKECMDVDVNDHEISRGLLAFIMMNDVVGHK